MSYRIFISHKNDEDSNEIGADLAGFLRKQGHIVFFDKDYLKAGMTWQQEIIDELLSSDVVIVILNEGTAESDWVQREIDMARARSISILPLPIVKDTSTVQDALNRFDLNATQFIKLGGLGITKLTETYDVIAERIEPLSEDTVANQQDSVDAWLLQRKLPEVPKKIGRSKPNFLVFTHPEAEGITFHISTGDASRMRGYDVLVNTENNYMQMARFYQTKTLSYAVRKNGAHMDGETLLDDTIQNQLYDNANKRGLPVPVRTVLATSAGHPRSLMGRQRSYRYILHAAAVRFVSGANPPNQPVNNIKQLIENCLDRIHKIDIANGEIKGKETIIVPKVDNYKPIQSVLFAVFGAGEGGKSFKKAAEDIISTFTTTIPICIDERDLSINKVGISIYAESDVHEIENVFLIHGFEKVEN